MSSKHGSGGTAFAQPNPEVAGGEATPSGDIGSAVPEKRKQLSGSGKPETGASKMQSRVAADMEELKKLRAEAEHLRNQLRLAVADNKNLERLMQRELEGARLFSISAFARDLIASCDNLEASLKNLDESDNVHAGVKMTWDGLMSTLGNHGIERIYPTDEVFDPRFHKAVTQAVDDSKAAGTVLEVVQAGYKLQDKVLRPALVVVSQKSS